MTRLTILIPVFNALPEVMACLDSLLASDAREETILFLDDGSTEEVRQTLKARCDQAPNIRLLSHFRNRGYTRNINAGLAAVTTPFVTILNSDTLVPSTWWAKTMAQLDADPTLAGIGPLSNSASYQSVPDVVGRDGKFTSNEAFGAEAGQRERVNALLSAMFAGITADVPILNGFCTTFRTHALRIAGGFDEHRFPRGYGEENDICLRLLAQGDRLAIDLSTFVFHRKSVSFGAAQKAHLSALGNKELVRMYGEHNMSAFTGLLRNQPLLALARSLVSRYFSAPGGSEMPQSIDRLLALPQDGADLMTRTIEGPASVRISASGCRVSARGPVTPTPVAVSCPQPNSMEIELDDGQRLPLVEGDWLWSACFSLAVASHQRPLQLHESYDVGAAAVAAMVPVKDLPFGAIYLS